MQVIKALMKNSERKNERNTLKFSSGCFIKMCFKA
jgi:hypothetical protein